MEGSMGERGVARDMMDKKMKGDEHSSPSHHMSYGQRTEMLHRHHMQTLWIYWFIIILGVWMITSPLTFDYGKNVVSPSGGREVWLSLADRITVLKWSDIISGIALIIFGWRSLTPNRPVSLWMCCFIGIWISAAPLIFWAPTAVAYLNETVVGALVIAFTILIPGMPNMIMFMKMGSEIPAGWSYNPSSWAQRWIMIVLGLAGWLVSRYLAAFQLGYIDVVWDPFFGNSSMLVLNSKMSHSLPISDAGLGSLAYTFEFLMGFMGSPSRWRTMPWMVALFGILVIPLGLVHIFLVISQPVLVGYWCTFCLMAAAIMLPMIPLEIDEVIAMGQHMVQATRKGEGFWKVFWKGGKPVEMNKDERTPDLMTLPHNFKSIFNASIWGMSFPWTLVLSTVLGIMAIAAPAFFHIDIHTHTADVVHLLGALIVVVAVLSMGEVIRTARYLNVALGLALAVVPWFLHDGVMALSITCVVFGVGVSLLSFPMGIKKETYGLWDNYVR